MSRPGSALPRRGGQQRLSQARQFNNDGGYVQADPQARVDREHLSSLSRTDLLDALLETKRTLRELEAERMTLRASNQRLEQELQRQQTRIEKLLDPRYSSGKEALQMRREIEKHVVTQQLKRQISVLRESLETKQGEVDALKASLKRTQINDLIAEKEEYYLEILRLQQLVHSKSVMMDAYLKNQATVLQRQTREVLPSAVYESRSVTQSHQQTHVVPVSVEERVSRRGGGATKRRPASASSAGRSRSVLTSLDKEIISPTSLIDIKNKERLSNGNKGGTVYGDKGGQNGGNGGNNGGSAYGDNGGQLHGDDVALMKEGNDVPPVVDVGVVEADAGDYVVVDIHAPANVAAEEESVVRRPGRALQGGAARHVQSTSSLMSIETVPSSAGGATQQHVTSVSELYAADGFESEAEASPKTAAAEEMRSFTKIPLARRTSSLDRISAVRSDDDYQTYLNTAEEEEENEDNEYEEDEDFGGD